MQGRRALPAAERARWDAQILDILTHSALFDSCPSLFVFVSVGEEVNTYPIIQAALGAGKQVLVPYLPGGGGMLAVPLRSLSDLVPGAYGIPTAKDAPAAGRAQEPEAIRLCLAPGLLFDREGYRLGYGGGYYDRFLRRHPESTAVGLHYAAQMSQTPLPREPWDQPLRYLLNEKGLFTVE